MCCTTNLRLYADNGRLGLRGVLLLLSLLLAERVIVVYVAIVDNMNVSVN